MKISDFELVEVYEVFSAQYIGCERELNLNREIINVNGSGIGLGHPVKATGCLGHEKPGPVVRSGPAVRQRWRVHGMCT